MLFLVSALLMASIEDMRKCRIPNWCIAIGMAMGLIMTFVSCGVLETGKALVQMTIIFFAFYPFYLLGGLGAGDCKLFMMLGCYFSDRELLNCLFISLIIAGAVSIGKIIFYKESRERILYLGQYIRKTALTGAIDNYEIDKSSKRKIVRLALPTLCSVIIIIMKTVMLNLQI